MTVLSIQLDSAWQAIMSALPAHSFHFGQSYFEHADGELTDSSIALYPLTQYGLISVSGPDASKFLQGQLTADIEALQAGTTKLAAHCNAKGRMHSSFFLHCLSHQDYLLVLPIDVLNTAMTALKKYAVFSKVELKDLSPEYAAIGISNNNDAPIPAIGNTVKATFSVPITGIGRIDYFAKATLSEVANNFDSLASDQLGAAVNWCGSALWEKRLVDAGIGLVQHASIDEFIPQMLNYDYIEGISFTKGCYTGQEIIARMKYRGKVKRRCYPFVASLPEGTSLAELYTTLQQSNNIITDTSGQNTGDLLNIIALNMTPSATPYDTPSTTPSDSPSTIQLQGLVVIKVASADSELWLQSEHQHDSAKKPLIQLPITLKTLPYAINNE